jgi:hypothetical protein
MDNVALIKALLINAAATNATAVCENTAGGGVPIDPLIQDTNLQGKGVMVYEEAKIQYAALLRAFHDKTGIWPDPKVATDAAGAPAGIGGLLPQLLSLLGKVPIDTPITSIGSLIDLLTRIGSAAPKKPGQELPASPAK